MSSSRWNIDIPDNVSSLSAYELNKLLGVTRQKTKKTKGKKQKAGDDYIGRIETALQACKIEYKKDEKLIPGRKFAADFFIEPDIVIEFEGAIFTEGRHTRGEGYARDCEKYRLFTLKGYKVLRYTSECIKDIMGEYKIIADIKTLCKSPEA